MKDMVARLEGIDKKIDTLTEELVKKRLYSLEERVGKLEAKLTELEIEKKVKERMDKDK
jgi:tetrahydromethanopterin S-methyltransferase subunit G